MSKRDLYDVTVEPSAAQLLRARSDNANEGSSSLSNLFSFSYNFKPDSASDSTRGALFAQGSRPSDTSDWLLELEAEGASSSSSHDAHQTVEASGSATRKPAHVFSGPQHPAKTFDLVLVWDDVSQSYRLDRMASVFTLKYERSKTTLSDKSHRAWSEDAQLAKRRATEDSPRQQTRDESRTKKMPVTNQRSRTALQTPATDVPRRSSRRLSQAAFKNTMDVEEFDSPPTPENVPTTQKSAAKSTAEEAQVTRGRELPAAVADERKEPPEEEPPLSGLRISHSVPRKTEVTAEPPAKETRRSPETLPTQQVQDQEPDEPGAIDIEETHKDTIAEAADDEENDPEEDDLALQLEREIEEEIELDADLDDFAAELDLSLAEAPSSAPTTARERRRSSQMASSTSSSQSALARETGARRVYGLGGPREEEEDLEDSD
ncbi:hypothetical protein BCV70DRAFT_201774 [Testicularia cyperi]|uniref:Transcription elongation factor Eaf N-terminal domain-containing protein n=1 Tax=Testicularia cyperi TaxID=1882483 RepID=A0A317XJM0_9BASI|nr:hypothetical protein BCV70DRAFT_201774 [Testicularia cyperi]